MTIIRKKRPAMLLFLSIIFLCLITLLTTLLVISPGRLKPYLDQSGQILAGSISEKIYIKIGGVKQGMFLRGKNIQNPVLLFVHGGPAFSEFFLVEKFPVDLEDHFTVCYWEQRGGGISYTPEVTLESMTLEQLASDAIEVTNYLYHRFGKEKIYIMAHSGGTAFAIQAVADYPQLFYAYIGIAQITRQAESEVLCYKYMMDQYLANGNSKMVVELNKYPILDNESFILPFFNSVLRDKAQHDLGIGTMHNMRSIIKDVFLPVWTCKAYTISEKLNIWISKFSFLKKTGLRSEIIQSDITTQVPRLEIPVYFFSGKYDLTVNKDLSKEYLKAIEAPVKGFYTFNESAHSPMFEEPKRLIEILVKDVINRSTNLADILN
ncbi:MAG: alpha/beta hydrolase [Prolixibacteraceae bacterium]|nr:alpha/beta hydrolase [Prolixibacteraceae bacterium]